MTTKWRPPGYENPYDGMFNDNEGKVHIPEYDIYELAADEVIEGLKKHGVPQHFDCVDCGHPPCWFVWIPEVDQT
tara:strand:- start:812 stop:1036 length:225 start_codon:yes stop_codon:yes gene_type:complete